MESKYRKLARGVVDMETQDKELGRVYHLDILTDVRNDLWNVFEDNEFGNICRKYNKDILPKESIIDRIKKLFK